MWQMNTKKTKDHMGSYSGILRKPTENVFSLKVDPTFVYLSFSFAPIAHCTSKYSMSTWLVHYRVPAVFMVLKFSVFILTYNIEAAN